MIHIEQLSINPHTDIMPCNEYRIQVRTIERWVPKAKDPSGRTVEYEAACIYGPDGRCVQEVSPSRLHALHQNYCQAVASNSLTCATKRLDCSTFAEEMYKMAIPYAA
jgi:hypothetical protein